MKQHNDIDDVIEDLKDHRLDYEPVLALQAKVEELWFQLSEARAGLEGYHTQVAELEGEKEQIKQLAAKAVQAGERRVAVLEGELVIESDRRKKAVNRQDRANELCDRVQNQMFELKMSMEWKPILKGSPEIEDIRFLLGKPDAVGDKKGIQAAGYWNEEHKFWVWPFGQEHKPTHYKELTQVK